MDTKKIILFNPDDSEVAFPKGNGEKMNNQETKQRSAGLAS